ncbi:MAG: hypothetical protein IJT75_06550 [Bacteroidaceae bacterium]|nr:hypothetical protein [Bacteroidaceae bacterium]
MRKKQYLRPDATVYALLGADGLLDTFSVQHAQNASEDDNPAMDVKEVTGEWDNLWE